MLEKQQVEVIPRLALNRMEAGQTGRQSCGLLLRGVRLFSQAACPAGRPEASILNPQHNFLGVRLPALGESTKTAEIER